MDFPALSCSLLSTWLHGKKKRGRESAAYWLGICLHSACRLEAQHYHRNADRFQAGLAVHIGLGRRNRSINHILVTN